MGDNLGFVRHAGDVGWDEGLWSWAVTLSSNGNVIASCHEDTMKNGYALLSMGKPVSNAIKGRSYLSRMSAKSDMILVSFGIRERRRGN